jgi:hypothetical protein
MDLDGGQSEVYTLDDSQKISIYSGSTDDLFEMIKYNGFDSIGLY